MKYEIVIRVYGVADALELVALVNDGWTIIEVRNAVNMVSEIKLIRRH